MSDPQLVNMLRQIQLLEGASNEHLEQLASISRCIEIPQGTTLFREGEDANTVYLIVQGRVALEICAPGIGCRRILTVNDGEILGWSPLLENGQFTATAKSLAPTLSIEIDGKAIRQLCEQYPRFGYEFMRCAALALGKRLSATRLQLLNVYGEDLTQSSAGTEGGGAS